MTALPFTQENLVNPEGKTVPVLDRTRVDFSAAPLGRKKTETRVMRAQGGEMIETRNTSGQIENTYIAKPGDAIFVNLHNANDIFVPGNPDGTRWQFDDFIKNGYEVTGGSMAAGEVRVKSTLTARILPHIVTEDVAIKDAWGPGAHQYLYAGATLKFNDNGLVTGIDKSAFDATWEVLPPAQHKAAPPRAKGP